jgi:coagulation factor 5/8 type
MKKFWKYIAASALVVSMIPLTACDDDDTVDPYDINYVYLYQPNSTYANVEYMANGDFMSGLSDPLKTVPVRLTKPAPQDLQIEVAIDPSLVEEYNQANNTEYEFLEGASIDNPVMKIAAGEYITPDSITINFGDHSGFMKENNGLILPIVIRSGAGLTISKSSRIFLTFNSSYRPNILKINTTEKSYVAALTSETWRDEIKKLTLNDLFSLTYKPYEEVTLNLAIDQSKVAKYNSDNGTNYKFKSDAKLETNTVTIGTDARDASISINTGDLTGVANEEEYIIPVTLKSASGAAVEAEGDMTVYVTVRGVSRMLNVHESFYNGVLMDNPVTCTVNGRDWSDIINADSWAYDEIDEGTPMEMDFGKVVNLSSIFVFHYNSYYSATKANLKTSVDGSTWLDWGDIEYTGMKQYYINLVPATNLRYVKLTFLKDNGHGIEIDGMRFYADIK